MDDLASLEATGVETDIETPDRRIAYPKLFLCIVTFALSWGLVLGIIHAVREVISNFSAG
jgi:hypothetical protein